MECSGKHRGLGVHLSFVRSISMDKWKETELAKMKAGGNAKARQFFDSQPDWDWKQALSERYNSKAAALYRDKIACESAGQEWSIETSGARDYVSRSIPMHKSASTGQFKGSQAGARAGANSQSASQWEESEWSSYQSNSSYQSGAVIANPNHIPEEITRAKDQFFSQKTAENASRPDDLPPSQGGRYTGFGNTASRPPPRSQSEFDFGSAWSTFSQLASKATESAVKISSIATQKATEIAGTVNEKVCPAYSLFYAFDFMIFVLLFFVVERLR